MQNQLVEPWSGWLLVAPLVYGRTIAPQKKSWPPPHCAKKESRGPLSRKRNKSWPSPKRPRKAFFFSLGQSANPPRKGLLGNTLEEFQEAELLKASTSGPWIQLVERPWSDHFGLVSGTKPPFEPSFFPWGAGGLVESQCAQCLEHLGVCPF